VGAQLNDVSILFPIAATDAELSTGYLQASSSGAKGVLLPQALYDGLGHITGSSDVSGVGGTGNAHWSDLRVVAVRLDPCFADLNPDPHGAGCHNQVRLVMQEVLSQQGTPEVYDSALHVFYALTREELVAFARALVALREASTAARLGGLQPHPLMTQQGLSGAYAQGVRALVLQYAGASNLTRVTEMSATQPGFAWHFQGFDVTATNPPAFTPIAIPTLSTLDTSQSFFRGFGAQMQGQYSPESQGPDDFAVLASVDTAAATDGGVRAAAWDALLRTENPSRNSPDTVDCAGCHLATPSALLIASPIYGFTAQGNPNAFTPDVRYVLQSELGPTFSEAEGFNLHAFSYVGRSAGINQRTVNESAAIAAYLNTLP
jgi:hypothetical protein